MTGTSIVASVADWLDMKPVVNVVAQVVVVALCGSSTVKTLLTVNRPQIATRDRPLDSAMSLPGIHISDHE